MAQSEPVFERIKVQAFASLSAERRQTTNLHLDRRIYQAGERIGPELQQIVAPKPSVLVFADDHPHANFAHDCRYLLFEPETGNLHSEIQARFPPFLEKAPATLEIFHEPVRLQPNPALFHIGPIRRCPILLPEGQRYAILYSGMSNTRHVNDLEFCYRMLIDRYAFDAKNIFVLNYDGTINGQDGIPTIWPGDGTAYRIKVTGKGDRAGFQAAFNALKGKIKADDLLFIHTNNHGGNSSGQSFLCQFPSWSEYWANDFCSDLATLPKYKSLIVMMEQCESGGFNAPVIAASTAAATSIASAAIASQSSWASPDGHWDSFARDWIAAQIGHDPNGAALAHNPDTNNNGAIEAIEAFNYASSVKNPSDSPNFNQSSAAGGNITLNQVYLWWWWWCLIVSPLLEKVHPLGPDPEYYERVSRLTPELQKLILPAIESAAAQISRELAPKAETAVRAAFGDARR